MRPKFRRENPRASKSLFCVWFKEICMVRFSFVGERGGLPILGVPRIPSLLVPDGGTRLGTGSTGAPTRRWQMESVERYQLLLMVSNQLILCARCGFSDPPGDGRDLRASGGVPARSTGCRSTPREPHPRARESGSW